METLHGYFGFLFHMLDLRWHRRKMWYKNTLDVHEDVASEGLYQDSLFHLGYSHRVQHQECNGDATQRREKTRTYLTYLSHSFGYSTDHDIWLQLWYNLFYCALTQRTAQRHEDLLIFTWDLAYKTLSVLNGVAWGQTTPCCSYGIFYNVEKNMTFKLRSWHNSSLNKSTISLYVYDFTQYLCCGTCQF